MQRDCFCTDGHTGVATKFIFLRHNANSTSRSFTVFVCLFFNHRQPTAATHLLFTLFKDSSSGTPSNQRKTPIHVPNFAPLSPPPAAAGGFSPMVNTPRGQGWDPILLLGHPTHSPLQPSLWLDTLTWTSGAHQERAAGSP